MSLKKYIPPLLIILLVIAFHWKLVFLGEVYAHSDVFLSFYPMKAFACKLLNSLKFPLWNPYWFMGHPGLAEGQTGFFYPINLVLFPFLPTYIAYNISTIIHYILAGIFTYLFARKLNLQKQPSLLAAITFTFSGFSVTQTFHIWANQSMVWLPLLFLLVEKIYNRQSSGKVNYVWPIILGLILGMQFLIGAYQIQIANSIAVMAYYFLQAFQFVKCVSGTSIRNRILHFFTTNKKYFFLFHLSLFIGIGISAIQLIPSFEISQFSARSSGLSSEWAYENSFHPLHFITFIFPYFFGHSISGHYDIPYGGFGDFWDLCGYIGILPFIFSLIAICFLKNNKSVKILFIIAGVFMLLAMGKYGLIYIPFHYLPVVKSYKCPGRFLIIVTFALSILAGFGFQYLSSNSVDLHKKTIIKRGITILFVMSLGVVFSLNIGYILLKDYAQSFETGYMGKIREHYDQIKSVFSITSPRVFLQLLIILASGIVLRIGFQRGWGATLKSSVIALVIADLFYFGMGYNPSTDYHIYTELPGSAKILKEDKTLFRIYSYKDTQILEEGFKKNKKYPYEEFREMIPASSNILYGIQHVFGSAGLVSNRNLELILMNRIKEISEGPAELIKYPKIMNMLNIKYVLSSVKIESDNLECISNDIVRIYRNNDVMPRAYFVTNYKVITDEDSILNDLKNNKFDPRSYAILEESPETLYLKFGISDSDGEMLDSKDVNCIANVVTQKDNFENIVIEDYGNESVKIKASVNKDGLLILGDTWYPGWKVFVNNVEKKMYRVNYIQRGVFLENGSHDIEFVYAPFPFTLGKYVTLFTLLTVFVFTVPRYLHLKKYTKT